MRIIGVAKRSRKRRPITRRDWRGDWRRGGKRRVWIGARAKRSASRPLFFALSAQQVESPRSTDWLGAAATLLGVVSWGVLAALLGA